MSPAVECQSVQRGNASVPCRASLLHVWPAGTRLSVPMAQGMQSHHPLINSCQSGTRQPTFRLLCARPGPTGFQLVSGSSAAASGRTSPGSLDVMLPKTLAGSENCCVVLALPTSRFPMHDGQLTRLQVILSSPPGCGGCLPVRRQ